MSPAPGPTRSFTLRNLHVWNALLIQKVNWSAYLEERDEYGNPQYDTNVLIPCRIDSYRISRPVTAQPQSTVGQQVEPDAVIICNTYPIGVLDHLFLPWLVEPLTIISIKTDLDEYGPHHININVKYSKV